MRKGRKKGRKEKKRREEKKQVIVDRAAVCHGKEPAVRALEWVRDWWSSIFCIDCILLARASNIKGLVVVAKRDTRVCNICFVHAIIPLGAKWVGRWQNFQINSYLDSHHLQRGYKICHTNCTSTKFIFYYNVNYVQSLLPQQIDNKRLPKLKWNKIFWADNNNLVWTIEIV